MSLVFVRRAMEARKASHSIYMFCVAFNVNSNSVVSAC